MGKFLSVFCSDQVKRLKAGQFFYRISCWPQPPYLHVLPIDSSLGLEETEIHINSTLKFVIHMPQYHGLYKRGLTGFLLLFFFSFLPQALT